MALNALIGEFEHEALNTRKLLECIPDDALNYRPSPTSWTTAQLASHIAEVYNWYEPTLHQQVFDMATYRYDKGDLTRTASIVAKFEVNLLAARHALKTVKEDSLYESWQMVMGETPLIPETPRIYMVRSLLFNHLYHHRGEMIVYLRGTGHKVPGLYGPTYEESQPAG
jgi:uncharacterized damage-inducible protein DinB